MAKIDKLKEKSKKHLDEDEKIKQVVMGAYETEILGTDSARNGIFIATNKRLVFYAKKLFGYDLEVFPYSNISSIEASKGIMSHKISFFASGNKAKMTWVTGEVDEFIELVRSKIGKISTSENSTAEDIPSKIGKLSKLKERGILTDDEFKKKKTELLSRL